MEQKFTRYFYSYAALEDLEACSIEMLCGAALSQWKLMETLAPGEVKVHVFNPSLEQDGWTSPHTIIQVVAQDMPFLVDSIRMEINKLGLNYYLMVHMGGMLVERDKQHKLQKIMRYRGQSSKVSTVEAPILIEVDCQVDPVILEEITSNLKRVIHDVYMAVKDWSLMRASMQESIDELSVSVKDDDEETKESIAFLGWLLDNNFTFLGVRDYTIEGNGKQKSLMLIPDSGKGVLREEGSSKKHRLLADLPEQARNLILSSDSRIIISKTNTISTIHRPVYTDYVGVKRFDANNNLIGERRYIGLYTSTAYNCDPLLIPFLRHKVSFIMKKSQLPMDSHSGKDLRHILSNLPRDDLFQATTIELYNLSMGILHLQERRVIRLFAREDAYGRYMSCLVYVPRENFSTHLLHKIQEILLTAFSGLELSFNTSFTASVLATIHFIIRVNPKVPRDYDLKEIEQQLIEAGKSWQDEFRERTLEHFGNAQGNVIYATYKDAFSAGYREVFPAHQATFDIEHVERLKTPDQLGMSVYRPLGLPLTMLKFKLFRINDTMPLSDALPILENMGFRVVGEAPFEIQLRDGTIYWINDFNMEYIYGELPDLPDFTALFEDAFLAVWRGRAENDQFNNLVVYAKFSWRQISVFRAYTKYLQQLGGIPFSVQYV
ncbi:MAG: NAD-glutamate dehydrogenase, partial [Coxiella sp. (in: Bacteria)]